MAASSDEVRAKLRRRSRMVRMSTAAIILFGVLFVATSVYVVKKRLSLGEHEASVLKRLQRDPDEFLKYSSYVPAITADVPPTQLNISSTFVLRDFGGWAINMGALVHDHCDMDHLQLVMTRKTDHKVIICDAASV